MLFWIFVIVLVVGIFGTVLIHKDIIDAPILVESMILICMVIGIIGTLTGGVYAIGAMIDEEMYMDDELKTYYSLLYRYENETNMVKRAEVITEIADRNDYLAWYREYQDDFWIGIFIPDIYDELEFIELD